MGPEPVVAPSTDPAAGPPAPGASSTWLILAGEGAGIPSPGPDVDVVIAADGSGFVGFLHELRPCLALVTCPPGGPTEILAAVTERRQRPALRIILLSDPTDVRGRLDALAIGFDDALPVSIDPEELTGRALLLSSGNRLVAGHERQIPVAPGVVLDLVGRRVRRGRPIPAGCSAGRSSWTAPGEPAYDGGSRTIDVHIRWLRAKIERDPARPSHVITVRGTSYRLDPFAD